MLKATELRKGVVFEYEGSPWLVTDFQNRAMGRGAGVVVVRVKNLATGNVMEKTFRSTDALPPAAVERRTVQYLYRDDQAMNFMDQSSYDQLAVDVAVLGEQSRFIAEGSEVNLLEYQGKVIGLDMPNNVLLRVTHTEPGVRGDTAASTLKPATVETGVTINVPLFINEGDIIKVDTRTGEYLERGK